MSDWRQNPNLVECFDNCVAMFRGMPVTVPPHRGEIIKRRREALGLSRQQLAIAAGYSGGTMLRIVSNMEAGSYWYQRIADALTRLEAERAQVAAE